MRLDDPLRDGEAESDAALVVFARLPELIEEMLDLLRRDARASVADIKDDLPLAAHCPERHISAFGCELECVAEEIAEHL